MMSVEQKKTPTIQRPEIKIRVNLLYAIVMGAGIATPAFADWHGGVTVGAGYSDNIRRVPSNEESETILSAGVNFDWLRDAPRLFADVAADVAYLDYVHDSFDKELVGNANALLRAKFVPDRFEWFFQDNFGQLRSDPFAPLTPDNRENVNYFATGPQLTMPLGSAMRGTVRARYSLVDYEQSVADNQGYGVVASLIRQLSQASSVSLNASGDRVAYKDDVNAYADHDVRSVFVNYTVEGARTKLLVDGGYNQLQYRVSDQKFSGTLLRLQLSRKLTPSSTLSLRLGREFTDASNAFQSDRQSAGAQQTITAANTAVVTDPFVNRYAGLSWDFARSRTGLGLNATYTKESYEVLTLQDRTRIQGDLYLSRQITPATSLRLAGTYLRGELTNTHTSFDELGESLEFAWRAGRLTTLRIQLQHFNRNADIANTEYSENRAWLSVTYGTPPGMVAPQH